MARIVGWSAHRIEELINIDKIIRPAYMSIGEKRAYEKIKEKFPRAEPNDNYLTQLKHYDLSVNV